MIKAMEIQVKDIQAKIEGLKLEIRLSSMMQGAHGDDGCEIQNTLDMANYPTSRIHTISSLRDRISSMCYGSYGLYDILHILLREQRTLMQNLLGKIRRLRKKEDKRIRQYIKTKLCDDIYMNFNVVLDNELVKGIANYI